MSKKIPKRYLTEETVKRKLKIDSFRNLSKDKIMEFTSMIPYMDKEVAISIINQFPVFVDFGKVAISTLSENCKNILESNQKSQESVVKGYQTILDALAKRMNSDGITKEEVKSITEDMIVIADKIAETDFNNKKFLDRTFTKIVLGVLAISGFAAAAIGVSSKFGGGEIPELDDDNDDDTAD